MSHTGPRYQQVRIFTKAVQANVCNGQQVSGGGTKLLSPHPLPFMNCAQALKHSNIVIMCWCSKSSPHVSKRIGAMWSKKKKSEFFF